MGYMRMTPSPSTSHNGVLRFRAMRYAMLLGIALLTIFLYVSYYATPMDASVSGRSSVIMSLQMSPYPVVEQPQLLQQSMDQNISAMVPEANSAATGAAAAAGVGLSNNISAVASSDVGPDETGFGSNIYKIPSQRAQPDANGGDPGSSSSSLINPDVVVNGANANTNNGPSSSASIPTSDKTGPNNNNNINVSLDNNNNNDKSESNAIANLKKKDSQAKTIIIPKVEVHAKGANLGKLTGQNGTKGVTTGAGQLDPSQGILTMDIYESGHSEPGLDICPNRGELLKLLVLVTSSPDHPNSRLAIRQTWGHYGTRRDIGIAFMIGATTNEQLETSLMAENYMYGDLIRSNSIDSYNNLTLKTVAMLEWVHRYCDQAKFILKTDDDMFINIPKLVQFMTKHMNDTRHIYGRLAKKWKPIRNSQSKYYVSPQQYLPKYFPDFTTGPAYLITSDVIKDLYTVALNQTYLKLEDVFTTGIVAQLAGVKRTHVTEFLNRRVAFNPCTIKRAISVHMVKGREQFDLWKKLMDPDLKCK